MPCASKAGRTSSGGEAGVSCYSGIVAAKSDGSAPGAAIDRLYAAPLEGFVELRKELAAGLRAAGDAAAAKAVLAIAKPSRMAWALNQVARRKPALVKAALEALAEAQAAQAAPDGGAMRATARAYRERITEVTDAAAAFVREAGGELPPAQVRRIGTTLQAVASGDDADLRDRLVNGRLSADVDTDDPFAGVSLEAALASHAAAPTVAPHRAAPRPPAEPGAAARARAEAEAKERARHAAELEKARARVSALEDEAKEARAGARDAEVAATRAQAEAERARRAVEGIERRLEEARRSLRGLN